jgi:hypothetical protein
MCAWSLGLFAKLWLNAFMLVGVGGRLLDLQWLELWQMFGQAGYITQGAGFGLANLSMPTCIAGASLLDFAIADAADVALTGACTLHAFFFWNKVHAVAVSSRIETTVPARDPASIQVLCSVQPNFR